MTRLNGTELERLAPPPGQQIHINHDDCPAGVDRKRRLYIKRKYDGTILAFCHHCGLSGYVSVPCVAGSYTPKGLRGDGGSSSRSHDGAYAVTGEGRVGRWRDCERRWVLRYLDDELVTKYGIKYDSSQERIALPIWYYGKCVGAQYRSLKGKPKYITQYAAGFKGTPCCLGTDSESLVLTEDIISAIMVREVTGFRTVALLGTNLNDNGAAALLGADNVWVWLDNDNADVKQKQRLIYNRSCALTGGFVKIVRTDTDPKAHTAQEILDVLQ